MLDWRSPCRIITFSDPLEEMEALIEFNRQRKKTVSQMMREGDKIEWIEKELAKRRQEATRAKPGERADKRAAKVGGVLPKGKSREEVAKKIGMSRGSMLRVTPIWKKAKAGDAAAIELMKKLDAGVITINAAYTENKKAEAETAEKP